MRDKMGELEKSVDGLKLDQLKKATGGADGSSYYIPDLDGKSWCGISNHDGKRNNVLRGYADDL